MASEGFQDQIIPSESEHSETLHILLSKSIEHNSKAITRERLLHR